MTFFDPSTGQWQGCASGAPVGPRAAAVSSRRALGPSRLVGFAYSLNPYRGCAHACSYCYSPEVIRDYRPWGTWLQARIDLPRTLARELRTLPRGRIGLGTVTDPYQPAEEGLRLTRRCLALIIGAGWPVSVQSKGTLMLRDLDLLASAPSGTADIGWSLSGTPPELVPLVEPLGAPPQRRLAALAQTAAEGIDTWAYFAPLIPGVSDEGVLQDQVSTLATSGVKRVFADPLRMRGQIHARLVAALAHELPQAARRLEDLGFVRSEGERLRQTVRQLCADHGLTFDAEGPFVEASPFEAFSPQRVPLPSRSESFLVQEPPWDS